ncbi:MAG TPA: DNA-binding protein [Desulfobacteraceae bacterium]|nr:DNA-binding protein [Desulfobacteraceae bacterium]|tara:strand:+ start:180 stop:647 length:468 start_codon:yes stop_codon:yes gene_type:complete
MAKMEIDDRFSRFGTVGFTATSRVNDFMGYLDEGRVMGTCCKTCKLDFFPPRADCSGCLGNDLSWFDAGEKTGSLLTFSKMKYGPKGFEDDLPYTIAVVDFGSFKMFGRMSRDLEDEDIRIGMTLRVRANPLEGGRINYVFHRAEPARDGADINA